MNWQTGSELQAIGPSFRFKAIGQSTFRGAAHHSFIFFTRSDRCTS